MACTPTPDPEIVRRREREFAAARTRGEVDALQERWSAEDRALAEASDYRQRQADDLAARVARLERQAGPSRKAIDDVIAGVSQALGRTVADERMRTEALIDTKVEALEERQLRFLGVHEPGRQYQPGNLVVRNGGLWHCNVLTHETPGRSSSWQLAVKSGEVGKGTVVA